VGRKPPVAGLNGTSPEIPFTVDADPYATAGKAAATARPGERGPASTGASAVGTQGREVHGTREIPWLRERLIVLLSGGYDKMDLDSFLLAVSEAS